MAQTQWGHHPRWSAGSHQSLLSKHLFVPSHSQNRALRANGCSERRKAPAESNRRGVQMWQASQQPQRTAQVETGACSLSVLPSHSDDHTPELWLPFTETLPPLYPSQSQHTWPHRYQLMNIEEDACNIYEKGGQRGGISQRGRRVLECCFINIEAQCHNAPLCE